MTTQPALADEQAVAALPDNRNARKPRARMERVNWSGTIILILCAVTVLLPLYVTISMSMKTSAQTTDGNALSLPMPFSFEGFTQAWELTKFPVGFAMSFLVTAGTVVATIIISAFASYAIIRNWDKKLFKWSFFYLLAAMFIPFPVVALPQIQLTGRFGLDNPLGVIILATMFQLSFSVLLFTAFLRSIPLELEESARIDGATTWQMTLYVTLPYLRGVLLVAGLFRLIDSIKAFPLIFILTDGGPGSVTEVTNYYSFLQAFNFSYLGYSSAITVVLVIFTVLLSWAIIRMVGWGKEDGE